MEMESPRKISVVGLGRLGLCQALTFEAAGFEVLGCDVHPAYVDSINERTLRSSEPDVEEMLKKATRLHATCSLERCVAFSDLVLILVATPTGIGEHVYDCGTLGNVLEDIAAMHPTNKHIVVGCTVLPGYLGTVGAQLLESCEGCTLSYNPEFIAQGRILAGLQAPDIVLIGEGSPAAGDRLQALYEACTSNSPKICRMSVASAELTKLALVRRALCALSFCAHPCPRAAAYALQRMRAMPRMASVGPLPAHRAPRCLCRLRLRLRPLVRAELLHHDEDRLCKRDRRRGGPHAGCR
jgi:nucleotide sugar dehydrogenase